MSTKSLWGMYDGEPFMENPHLGVLAMPANPKRYRKRIAKGRYEYDYVPKGKTSRKGMKMAVRRRKRAMPAGLKRYWATHRRKGAKSAPARRRRSTRRRKNWISPGMVVAANPRRRRRSMYLKGARRNPHHRRRHRNPAILGFQLPAIKSVVFAGIGFAGPSLLSGFLSQMVPSVMSQASSMGIAGKYLVKVGSVLGLTYLTRRFVGSNEANMVLIGGGVNVGLSLMNDFAPGFLPANPLGMYVPNRGMRAYVPNRGMQGMRALPTPSTQMLNRGSVIPTAAPFRSFSKFGVAQRLMRY